MTDTDPPIILDKSLWLSENPANCMKPNSSSKIPLFGKGLHPQRYSNYEEMGLCKECPRKPYKSDLCIYRRPKNPFNESAPYIGCAGNDGYSEEVLMSCLIRLWKQLGHPPNTQEINDSSAPSATTYCRRYGSLAKAKENAQLSMCGELPEWVCPYCEKVLKSEPGWESHTKGCKKKKGDGFP